MFMFFLLDGGNKAVQSSSGVEVFRMDFDVNAKQNGNLILSIN